MLKPAALILLLFIHYNSFSQNNMLLFKKRGITISRYPQGSFIALMTKDKQWHKGEIISIKKDSFYISPVVEQYNMFGNTTLRFRTESFAYSDVHALPANGVQVDYINGRFQVSKTGGKDHLRRIKDGSVLMLASAGYVALNLINSSNNFRLPEDKEIVIGSAAVFTGGLILKIMHKRILVTGKKYELKPLLL